MWYKILFAVGACLENKKNSKDIIKIFGYSIDKMGVVVYINHDIYSSNMNDCEIIKLDELNTNWKKASNIFITETSSSILHIGYFKDTDEEYNVFVKKLK